MGIHQLLKQLEPAVDKQVHVGKYSGARAAVDASSWLYKGAYACAQQLATDKPTTKYVDYVLERIRMLRHFKVEPYMVFGEYIVHYKRWNARGTIIFPY